MLRNPRTNLGSRSSKKSNSEVIEGDNESVGAGETPEEGMKTRARKAAKRRLKEKANNNIIDLVTKQMNVMVSGTSVVGNAFLKFIHQASEDKSHKKMIREQKLKLDQDRIMIIDTSSMAPDQVTYTQLRRAEILKKKFGEW